MDNPFENNEHPETVTNTKAEVKFNNERSEVNLLTDLESDGSKDKGRKWWKL